MKGKQRKVDVSVTSSYFDLSRWLKYTNTREIIYIEYYTNSIFFVPCCKTPLTSRCRDDCPRGKLPPWVIAPRTIFPWIIAPRKIAPENNCPPPGKLPTHHKISLENNCPHWRKFPLASTTSELRQTMHCLRVPWYKSTAT